MKLRLWPALVLVAGAAGCPAQTVTCEVYVACQQAIDADVDTRPWQPDGACWDLPSAARDCDAQCRVALDALHDTPSPPAACVEP